MSFFATNDNGEVSDSILWDTFKVVMRGHIISFESSKKRALNSRLRKIEETLPVLEQAYRVSLSKSDYNKILKLKYEYNSILNGQIGNLLLKLKQNNFELGDKPGKLLARQLRGKQAKKAIHMVKSKTGILITNPNKINECFREFYSELYTSKITDSDINYDSFLCNLIFQNLVNPLGLI